MPASEVPVTLGIAEKAGDLRRGELAQGGQGQRLTQFWRQLVDAAVQPRFQIGVERGLFRTSAGGRLLKQDFSRPLIRRRPPFAPRGQAPYDACRIAARWGNG
jgi:hypothetical protein